MATVTVHGGAAGLAQEVLIGKHRLVADEPVVDGGADARPGPVSSEPNPAAVSSTAPAMNSASNIGRSFRSSGGRETSPARQPRRPPYGASVVEMVLSLESAHTVAVAAVSAAKASRIAN